MTRTGADPLIGKIVSHYEIVAKLGGGAMGVVYSARDKKLGRLVALKFLPPQWSHDETAIQRLIREAQTASATAHRNLCTIHDIESTDDGELFIVMAYYSGQTLKQRLEQSELKLEDALEFAAQVSEGLAKAHAQGVVHRDIKPGNLMITDDCVTILDFGLAKASGSLQLTITGSQIGTVAYMSPEQARGDEADVRSDIWAVGVVLFEMLAGRVPFAGDYPEAVFHAIKNEPAPSLRKLKPDIPEAVEHLVDHALQKDRNRRFQNAREIARELRLLQGRAAPVGPGVIGNVTSGSHASGRATDRFDSIAVLPFRNMSREKDQNYFCEGLTEEFIDALTKIRGLRVAARTSVFRLKGHPLSEICRTLNVDTVLDGSVRKTGNRLRIAVELVDAKREKHLWSEQFNRELEDVFAVQDEIARTVVKTLRGKLATDDSTRPVVSHAKNVEAYQAYLEGRYHWNKRTETELKKSVRCFERAIASDPGYALAHVGLADALVTLGTYGALPPRELTLKASEALTTALQLDSQLAEAYVCRGCLQSVCNWSWVAAEQDFKRAIELNSDSPAAHHWYAINYLVPVGRFDEATSQLRHALDLDPLSLVVKTSLGMTSYFAGHHERALHELSQAIELDESFVLARVFRGRVYTTMSRFDEARAEFEAATRSSPDSPDALAGIGSLCGVSGDTEGARTVLAKLQGLSERRYVSPTLFAQVHAALGDKQGALDRLEEAEAGHAADLAWVAVRPVFVRLRAEPRFIALLRRMSLVG